MTVGTVSLADRPAGLADAYPRRLARLAAATVERTGLDLSGAVVLTEAATGPYAVTATLAGLAGARTVYAWTRPTRHGSVEQAAAQTMAVATAAGVSERVEVSAVRDPAHVRAADVVTNSGHVRPLDAEFIAHLRPGAVVPMMFEAWEVQAGRFDVDLAALAAAGVDAAGTNERHPDVDVFGYLGLMAVKGLLDAGVPAYRSRVAVLCDNPFEPFLVRGLRAAGATVETAADPQRWLAAAGPADPDAVVLAMRPTGAPVLDAPALTAIGDRWPATPLVQLWGDLDRAAAEEAGLPCVPAAAPPAGHMGVLPSDLGPEPVVRLQAGGLRVAQVLRLPRERWTDADRAWVDEL